MRVENNGIRYFSFDELSDVFKIKPTSKTKNNEKFEEQKNKFLSKHKCRGCGKPMTWVGENIMICDNPKCKGIKRSKKNEDGTEYVWYDASYSLLDEVGVSIAKRLFD